MKFTKGITLIELIVVMAIVAVLFGLASVNLLRIQRQTDIDTTVEVIVSDLRSQQLASMDGESNASASGIYFEADKYTLFSAVPYLPNSPDNFTINLQQQIQISTPQTIIFATGSGELFNPTAPATITITNPAGAQQRTITINKYGVITGIN